MWVPRSLWRHDPASLHFHRPLGAVYPKHLPFVLPTSNSYAHCHLRSQDGISPFSMNGIRIGNELPNPASFAYLSAWSNTSYCTFDLLISMLVETTGNWHGPSVHHQRNDALLVNSCQHRYVIHVLEMAWWFSCYSALHQIKDFYVTTQKFSKILLQEHYFKTRAKVSYF